MREKRAWNACLFILILAGSVLPQVHPLGLSINSNTTIAGVAQVATEELTPGEPKAGSLPANDTGNIQLGETQYTVQYPGGGVKLVLGFHPDFPMSFFLRRNLPVTVEDKSVVADFGPFTSGSASFPRNLPLDAATYFIAVRNSSSRTVNFTLTANLIEAPTASTIDLGLPTISPDKVELGSIQMPEPGSCSLGLTQYTISLADSMFCSAFTSWSVSLRGDQPLKLYARLGERVTVENGEVVADHKSDSTTAGGFAFSSSSVAPAAGVRTYFIAVENCNPNTTDYLLTFQPLIGDVIFPAVDTVFVEKKALNVVGCGLGVGGTVLFNGEPQKTKHGGVISGRFCAQDVLIVKKGGKRIKKIKPGESLTVTVKTDSGCTTFPVQVGPNG